MADGRDIDVLTVGPDDGLPLVIHEGTTVGMVPFAHGQGLAAHVPGARVHLEPGAGHLTMTVTVIGRILDELLDLAGRR